ncbi:PepSY domain-containing protein [Nannocystis sp. SCPEA4]|uniref:PepSY domain-containing protein n=1 Tax=Nannocystis sp. SCPEA4 TaxID=2996787 RepID=UPI00226D9E7C|nr:PepSY domain-containing protein [Nannocystis sp. SCPEA4]MCY1056547.1 PepSY domain-containing protein [Nannocystis sp. SCPEA4]
MHVVLMSLFLSLAPTACRATTAPTPVDAGASAPVATTSRDAAAKPKLSLEEARAAALKQVPGTVISAELEREHGRWIYSVEIQPTDRQQPRKEVEIDGDDGSVVAVEVEDADD